MFHPPAAKVSAPPVALPERRRAPRFSLCSLALVLGEGGQMGHCTLEDLSFGGARLTGMVQLAVGEEVRVLLPVRCDRPAFLVGRVMRRRSVEQAAPEGRATQLTYGVMFAPAQQRQNAVAATAALAELSEASLRRMQPQRPAVLVLDGSNLACGPTVAALGLAGYPAVAVTNSFDALGWLLSAAPFAAAVVNVAPKSADGASLLGYLADEHPTVRRVAIHAQAEGAATAAAQLRLPGALLAADVPRVVAAA